MFADDRRFYHLLAARIANTAHKQRDPDRAVGNSLQYRLSSATWRRVAEINHRTICLVRFVSS